MKQPVTEDDIKDEVRFQRIEDAVRDMDDEIQDMKKEVYKEEDPPPPYQDPPPYKEPEKETEGPDPPKKPKVDEDIDMSEPDVEKHTYDPWIEDLKYLTAERVKDY